jgi:hypothetical protein
MSDATIDEKLVQRLQKIAERESRSVNEVVSSMIDKYKVEAPASEPKHKSKYPDWLPRTADSPDYDPLDDFIGMIDADITDASTTVRETMEEYYRKKSGGST